MSIIIKKIINISFTIPIFWMAVNYYLPDYTINQVSPTISSAYENATTGKISTNIAGASGNAWSAFDNRFTGEVFHSAQGETTGSITIRLNKPSRVNRLKIAMQTDLIGRLPSNFILFGLDKSSHWVKLLEVTDEKYSNLTPETFKVFDLENDSNYELYKIEVQESNQDDYLTFSELVLENVIDNRKSKYLALLIIIFSCISFFFKRGKPKQASHMSLTPNNMATVIIFFVFTNLFFIPLELYTRNINEFYYGIKEISVTLFLFCVIISTLLNFLARHLSKKSLNFSIWLMFMFGFLPWISACFFPWEFGDLDGKAFPSLTSIAGVIHILTIFGVFLWIRALNATYFVRFIPKLAIVLILTQSISLVVNIICVDTDQKISATATNGIALRQFTLNNKNVLIILLDMFQSNVFQEIIDKNYFDTQNDFDGFIFYRNAVSRFPVTVASVPQILTGVTYDNTVTHSEYIKKTFNESSLFKQAHDSGFSIAVKPLLYNELMIDNSLANSSENRIITFSQLFLDISKLLDLTFFTDLPYLFKNNVYKDGQWLLQPIVNRYIFDNIHHYTDVVKSSKIVDVKFVDDFVSQSTSVVDKPAFKFYHLFGNHPPLDLNENIQYEAMDFNLQNSIKQGTGAMKLAVKMLTKLKELEVYDNTMIFIIADHGSGVETKISGGVSEWLSRGVPLIMAKNFYHHGQLHISDAPVELSDVGFTISSRNNWDNKFYGYDLFDIPENLVRSRRFINTSTGDFLHGKFERYEVYDVVGHSWDINSWHKLY